MTPVLACSPRSTRSMPGMSPSAFLQSPALTMGTPRSTRAAAASKGVPTPRSTRGGASSTGGGSAPGRSPRTVAARVGVVCWHWCVRAKHACSCRRCRLFCVRNMTRRARAGSGSCRRGRGSRPQAYGSSSPAGGRGVGGQRRQALCSRTPLSAFGAAAPGISLVLVALVDAIQRKGFGTEMRAARPKYANGDE